MEITKSYFLNGALTEISSILSDLEIYGRYHPLIRKVKRLDNIDNKILYTIIERPYSWLPINISYTAAVKKGLDQIQYEITEIPFTRAFINYKLIPQAESSTEVIFKLVIQSKAIGKSLLQGKMLKAQDQLMDQIKKDLNSKT